MSKPSVIDYLNTEFRTFEELPFSPIDALVLSQFAMVRAEVVVPPTVDVDALKNVDAADAARYQAFDAVRSLFAPDRHIHFRDLLCAEYYDRLYVGLVPDKVRQLALALAASPRFRTMELVDVASLFDAQENIQFAGMAFVYRAPQPNPVETLPAAADALPASGSASGTLGAGEDAAAVDGIAVTGDFAFIAFRGTDVSFTGWRECFDMSYMDAIPAQKLAARYVDLIAGRLPRTLMVGGHSKGGNLALYAAARCMPEVRERIRQVYTFDAPGLKPGVLNDAEWSAIATMTSRYVPQDSFIGMLLEDPIPYRVVTSTGLGVGQHDPYTWVLRRTGAGAEASAETSATPETSGGKAADASDPVGKTAARDAGGDEAGDKAGDGKASCADASAAAPDAEASVYEIPDGEEIGGKTSDAEASDGSAPVAVPLSAGAGKAALAVTGDVEDAMAADAGADADVTATEQGGWDFVYQDDLTPNAKFSNATFADWLKRYDDKQTRTMVDAMFAAMDASGAEDFSEVITFSPKSFGMMRDAIANTPEDLRNTLIGGIGTLMECAARRAVDRPLDVDAQKETKEVPADLAGMLDGIRSAAGSVVADAAVAVTDATDALAANATAAVSDAANSLADAANSLSASFDRSTLERDAKGAEPSRRHHRRGKNWKRRK
jgi:hypothetical protein